MVPVTMSGQQQPDLVGAADRLQHPCYRSNVWLPWFVGIGVTTAATMKFALRKPCDVAIRQYAELAHLIVDVGDRHPGYVDVVRTRRVRQWHKCGNHQCDDRRGQFVFHHGLSILRTINFTTKARRHEERQRHSKRDCFASRKSSISGISQSVFVLLRALRALRDFVMRFSLDAYTRRASTKCFFQKSAFRLS